MVIMGANLDLIQFMFVFVFVIVFVFCLCIRKMLCICKMLCNGDMIRCSGWWMLIVGAKLTCQICFNLCQPRTLHDGLRFYSSHTNTNTNTNRNTNMWSHDHSFYSSSLPLIYTSTISSALWFDQYSHLDFTFVLISIKVRNGRIERPCCLSSTLGGSKEWTNYMSLLSFYVGRTFPIERCNITS